MAVEKKLNRRNIGLVLLILFFMAGMWYSSRHRPPTLALIKGQTMGTTYAIKFLPPSKITINHAALKAKIDTLLGRINGQMSTYDPDSELSRINKDRTTDWVSISQALWYVLDLSRKISEDTGGAFDITVGPVVNLWGFGPDLNDDQVPDKGKLQATLQRVGYGRLQLKADPPSLKKSNPDLYLDLSAIAKGYAVDQVANLLEDHRVDNYLVEIGGELKASGDKGQDRPWRVAIEKPDSKKRVIEAIVRVDNKAVATSGDYRNFFEIDGKRYSHAINPKTGWPVDHQLASVTVIHDSSAVADALATAILVMGVEQGMDFAEKHHLPVYLVMTEKEGFKTRASSAIGKYIK